METRTTASGLSALGCDRKSLPTKDEDGHKESNGESTMQGRKTLTLVIAGKFISYYSRPFIPSVL